MNASNPAQLYNNNNNNNNNKIFILLTCVSYKNNKTLYNKILAHPAPNRGLISQFKHKKTIASNAAHCVYKHVVTRYDSWTRRPTVRHPLDICRTH